MSLVRDFREALKGLAQIGSGELRSPENPDKPITYQELAELTSIKTSTGQSVTPDNAMRVSTILACVRVLAESVAMIPWITYRTEGENNERRVKARDTSIFHLLKTRPNPQMSSFTYREQALMNLILRGNHYAEIERNLNGDPVALWPIPAQKVEPYVSESGELWYIIDVASKRFGIPSSRMIHVPIMGNGIKGVGLIDYARETVGYSKALDEYQGKFFQNGANLSGYLKHPKKLSDEAKTRLKTSWEAAHTGLSQAHRIAVLEEGLDWVKTSVNPQEAQALDARKLTRSELAGVLRVPSHFINDLERATFSNIEHQSIAFVVYDLMPWLVRIEQEYSHKLFTVAERQQFFVEFNVDGLMRGDTLQRAQALEVKRRNGVLTANEWRLLDNQNPVESDYGDALLVPQHNAIITKDGQILDYNPPQQADPFAREIKRPADESIRSKLFESDEFRAWETRTSKFAARRRGLEKAFEPVLSDSVNRVVKRESRTIRDFLKKAEARSQNDFRALLDEFYENSEWIDQYTRSVFQSLFAATAEELSEEVDGFDRDSEELLRMQDDYIAAFVRRYTGRSLRQLRALLTRAIDEALDYPELIEERLDDWEQTRALKVADEETTRGANALAKTVYQMVGVQTLRWFANPGACPFCSGMHGKRVQIDRTFVVEGEEIEGNGETMTVSHSMAHPPLHDGCECQVMGG